MILSLNKEDKTIFSLNPKEWDGYQSDEVEFTKAEPLVLSSTLEKKKVKETRKQPIKKNSQKAEVSKANKPKIKPKRTSPTRARKPRNTNGSKPK